MKCAKCGQILPDDSLFCPFCGTELSAVPAPATDEPASQTQSDPTPVQKPSQNMIQLLKRVDKKKLFIIAGIAAAILLVIGIGLLISRVLTPGQQDATGIQCPSCGQEASSESQFCRNCGEPLVKEDAQGDSALPTDGESTTAATSGDTDKKEDNADTGNEDTPVTAPNAATQPSHTHQYVAATCIAPKTCACGATSGSPLGHVYKTAVTAPSCTSQGYTTYSCSTCGNSYKDNYVSAAHSYQDYKCTLCGTVDKAHAYEYLMAWVKRNGTTDGGYIDMGFTDEDVNYYVSYSIEDDNVFVRRDNTLDGTYSMSALFLVDYYHGTTFGSFAISGTMNPASFDGVSPVNYSSYTGPADSEAIMAELARTSICTLLDFLEWFLAEYELGITIADLGFTAY